MYCQIYKYGGRYSNSNKIHRKPGTTSQDVIFDLLRKEEALCADLRDAMKRRHLAELRVELGAGYRNNGRYRAEALRPAAILTLTELASFPNGLEAMNRTDQLLAINATNREEWSIDGDLYRRHQKKFVQKELHKLQSRIIHVVTERTAKQTMLHKHIRGLRESKMFLESLNKRWKQLEDGVKKYNEEIIRLERLGEREVPRQLSAQSLKRDGLSNEEIWDLDRMHSQEDWAIHGYVRQGIDSHFRLLRANEESGQLELHFARMRLWLMRQVRVIILFLDNEAHNLNAFQKGFFVRLLLHRLRVLGSLLNMKGVPVSVGERWDMESMSLLEPFSLLRCY